MIHVQLTVNKASVYNEVAKTSSYTGSKMVGDEGAYERIFATDADQLMLERFWNEACAGATNKFRQFLLCVNSQPEGHNVALNRNYEVELELSYSFDMNLTDSMESSLFSYFVAYIVSKWYKFSNKAEAEDYATEAAVMMDDVMRKIYHRKKPVRLTTMIGN